MITEDLIHFLHLFHGCGSRQAILRNLLIQRNHLPDRISLQEISARLAGDGPAPISAPTPDQIKSRVEADLDWIKNGSNRLISYLDPAYPVLLRQTGAYPLLLYASGDTSLLQQPQIAIVGSRQCTPGGAQNAFEFASELASAGLVITSGMALGVDSQAHLGALSRGQTIAVTATGADVVYPRRNLQLCEQIRDRGLMITEFPLGTGARAEFFPRRNRIISGLALATLVVEATRRSGSLITARLAAEQGREVFALPGSIHNPQSRGCHQLIRDGAGLAENPSDIVHEIGNLLKFSVSSPPVEPGKPCQGLEPGQQQLLNLIGFDPVTTDGLVERSGLTVDQVSSMLLILELNDLIQSAPGGCFVRI